MLIKKNDNECVDLRNSMVSLNNKEDKRMCLAEMNGFGEEFLNATGIAAQRSSSFPGIL